MVVCPCVHVPIFFILLTEGCCGILIFPFVLPHKVDKYPFLLAYVVSIAMKCLLALSGLHTFSS